MKLHLPLSLRLSLALSVAAMAAAPSHAVVNTIDITGWSGYQDGAVTVGRTVNEDGTASVNSQYVTLSPKPLWDTEWSMVFSAKGSSLNGSLTLIGLEMDSSSGNSGTVGFVEGATMSGGTLTLTTWSHQTGASGAVDFSGYDNVTFVMSRHSDGKLTFTGYNSADFTHEIFSYEDSAAQSFSKYYFRGFALGASGTHTKFDNSSNHVSFASDDDIGSYELTKVGYSLGGVATVSDLVSYYYGDQQHRELTWSGGESGNWSDASWGIGGQGNGSFNTLDSVIFATEGATVTVDTSASAGGVSVNANTHIVLDDNLSATSLTVADEKTLTLTGEGTLETNSLSGGVVDVSGSKVAVDGTISDTVLTVENGASVTALSLAGTMATVEKATDSTSSSTLALAGTKLGAAGSKTEVKGALTLTGGERVTVAGEVTLGSVVNNLTGKDDYAFIGYADAHLTFTEGETDLTHGNTHSAIGINTGKITVGEKASLKTAMIYNSSSAKDNAHVVVEEGGSLEMTGTHSNTMLTLTSKGAVKAKADLLINNGGGSNLGGTVDVGGTLTLNSGTAVISGDVAAKQVAGTSSVLQGSEDGKGRLTVRGGGLKASDHSNGSSLSGNFTVVKEGSYIQNFGSGGSNSGFTGSLVVKGGTMNLANFGENTEVSLQDISISSNSTLRLYAKTLSGSDAGYRAHVSAKKVTVGEGGGSLTANLIMAPASEMALDGTLTLDGSLTLNQTLLSGSLLSSMSEKGDKVTLVDGLAYSSLHIGGGAAASLLSATEADSWLTGTDEMGSYHQFSAGELEAAFGNLDPNAYMMRYYGTETGTSGSLVMVLVPEPTTATLSLLALAGLCARRRRK